MDIDVEETLRSYRRDLPSASKTAQAIDRGASLEEISECAEEEGVHLLASMLFEIQQAELEETSLSYEVLSGESLRQFRRTIPNNSKTAAAIDRGASWDEISRCSEEEGLRQHQITTVMFAAGQERLLSNK